MYLEIETALINGVSALLPDGALISYPDSELTDKGDGIWYALHNLRGQSSPVTMGNKGEDNHPGIFQIDVNAPKGSGSGMVLGEVDKLVPLLPAGKAFTANGQTVKLLGTSVSPGRTVGGYYRVSITLSYYSRSVRNL